ncbi:MAG: hypothetical protein K6G84_00020, partial [Lachnospiraceae bacterium]|nr:hypothetical protein [Lachnospiraceae bacterium]
RLQYRYSNIQNSHRPEKSDSEFKRKVLQIYKEKNDRGRFLKSISFKFPVYYKGKEIKTLEAGEEGLQEYAEGLTKENLEGWDKEKTGETCVLLAKTNVSEV